jgi:hypothetical protein
VFLLLLGVYFRFAIIAYNPPDLLPAFQSYPNSYKLSLKILLSGVIPSKMAASCGEDILYNPDEVFATQANLQAILTFYREQAKEFGKNGLRIYDGRTRTESGQQGASPKTVCYSDRGFAHYSPTNAIILLDTKNTQDSNLINEFDLQTPSDTTYVVIVFRGILYGI